MRENTSRPSRSTPKGCSPDGPVGVPKRSSASELCAFGPGVPAMETMTGANEQRVHALPVDRLTAALRRYGRLR